MQILVLSRTCRITFDKEDPYYAKRTLVLEGEGFDEHSFCIHKHLDIFWLRPSLENSGHSIGVTVEESERKSLLSYVVEKAKETGYTLTVW